MGWGWLNSLEICPTKTIHGDSLKQIKELSHICRPQAEGSDPRILQDEHRQHQDERLRGDRDGWFHGEISHSCFLKRDSGKAHQRWDPRETTQSSLQRENQRAARTAKALDRPWGRQGANSLSLMLSPVVAVKCPTGVQHSHLGLVRKDLNGEKGRDARLSRVTG